MHLSFLAVLAAAPLLSASASASAIAQSPLLHQHQQTSDPQSPSPRQRYDSELRVNGVKVFPDQSQFDILSGDYNPRPKPPIIPPSPFPGDPTELYNGLRTFSRGGAKPVMPVRCFGKDNQTLFDVAVVGVPFDTATSYRPGARFGPNGIRQGSQTVGGFNRVLGIDPYETFTIVDCGDIPTSLFSNPVALYQIEEGMSSLLSRPTKQDFSSGTNITKSGKVPPRVLTLGGDHTITLPILRALEPVYGPITVIHFDSHLDTWAGEDPITHGNYFYIAWKEGLMTQNNIHVGIKDEMWTDWTVEDQPRLPRSGSGSGGGVGIKDGMWNRTAHNDDGDDMVGFSRVYAEEIDEVGIAGVVKKIRDRVGNNPVYITLDVDVMDPFAAPATGTPVPGGYTPREVIRILQGFAGLKVIGADIVEVAPAYDSAGEITSIVAAHIGWQMLSLMALTPL